jgi:N-acetylmuramoyl-L-alanine amidase
MALACRDELVRHGVQVRMSRTKDENDTLNQEIIECNTFNPDLAVDVHNNAGGGDGAEVYYSVVGGTGKTLALNIEAEIKKIGQNSRGVKTKVGSGGADYFGFIRETSCPAVIIEGVFVDNKKDASQADTLKEQQAFGVAYAKGILKTLGIAYKETTTEKKTAQTSSSGKLYRVQVGAYKEKANAEAMLAKVKKAGFDAVLVQS